MPLHPAPARLVPSSIETAVYSAVESAMRWFHSSNVTGAAPALIPEVAQYAKKSKPAPNQKSLFGAVNPKGVNDAQGQKRMFEADGTRWITIGGHAEGGKKHAGGTPAQIDQAGNIVAGPQWLKDAGVTSLGQPGAGDGDIGEKLEAKKAEGGKGAETEAKKGGAAEDVGSKVATPLAPEPQQPAAPSPTPGSTYDDLPEGGKAAFEEHVLDHLRSKVEHIRHSVKMSGKLRVWQSLSVHPSQGELPTTDQFDKMARSEGVDPEIVKATSPEYQALKAELEDYRTYGDQEEKPRTAAAAPAPLSPEQSARRDLESLQGQLNRQSARFLRESRDAKQALGIMDRSGDRHFGGRSRQFWQEQADESERMIGSVNAKLNEVNAKLNPPVEQPQQPEQPAAPSAAVPATSSAAPGAAPLAINPFPTSGAAAGAKKEPEMQEGQEPRPEQPQQAEQHAQQPEQQPEGSQPVWTQEAPRRERGGQLGAISGLQAQRTSQRQLGKMDAEADRQMGNVREGLSGYSKGVIDAFERGEINENTPGIHADARLVIQDHKARTNEAGRDNQAADLRKWNDLSPGDLSAGMQVYAGMNDSPLTVAKINANSITVRRPDGSQFRASPADLSRMSWRSRQMAEAAVREGKPIPAEILAQYPDLAARFGGQQPQAAAPAVPAAAPTLNPTRSPAQQDLDLREQQGRTIRQLNRISRQNREVQQAINHMQRTREGNFGGRSREFWMDQGQKLVDQSNAATSQLEQINAQLMPGSKLQTAVRAAAAPATPAAPAAEPSTWNPAGHLQIAADSPERLRSSDVSRVLEWAPAQHRMAMANYLVQNRPDLKGEVSEVMAELQGNAPAASPAPPASAPAAAPASAPAAAPGIAGAQRSLFGGTDQKSGQKSLFNIAKPAKGKYSLAHATHASQSAHTASTAHARTIQTAVIDAVARYSAAHAASHQRAPQVAQYARYTPAKGQRSLFGADVGTEKRQEVDNAKGQKRLFAPDGGRWITIGGHAQGNAKHSGGTHVKIDGDGNILAGGKWLQDQGVTNLDQLGEKKAEDEEEAEGETGAEGESEDEPAPAAEDPSSNVTEPPPPTPPAPPAAPEPEPEPQPEPKISQSPQETLQTVVQSAVKSAVDLQKEQARIAAHEKAIALGAKPVEGVDPKNFSVFGLERGNNGHANGSVFLHNGKRYIQISRTARQYMSRDFLEDIDEFSAQPGGGYSWTGVEIEPNGEEQAYDQAVRQHADLVKDRKSQIEGVRRAIQNADNHVQDGAALPGMRQIWKSPVRPGFLATPDAIFTDGKNLEYRTYGYDNPNVWRINNPELAQQAEALMGSPEPTPPAKTKGVRGRISEKETPANSTNAPTPKRKISLGSSAKKASPVASNSGQHQALVDNAVSLKSKINAKGDTFANRDKLKSLGAKWDAQRKLWTFQPHAMSDAERKKFVAAMGALAAKGVVFEDNEKARYQQRGGGFSSSVTEGAPAETAQYARAKPLPNQKSLFGGGSGGSGGEDFERLHPRGEHGLFRLKDGAAGGGAGGAGSGAAEATPAPAPAPAPAADVGRKAPSPTPSMNSAPGAAPLAMKPFPTVGEKKKDDSGISEAHRTIGQRFGIPPEAVRSILETPFEELKRRDAESIRLLHHSNDDGPPQFEKYPMGTARIPSYFSTPESARDAYVDFMTEHNPADLVTSEHAEGIQQRDPSYPLYVEWAKQGIEPPPIRTAQPVKPGEKIASANRRRVLAAQEAGSKTIKAWHSVNNSETGNPLKYGDVLDAARQHGNPAPPAAVHSAPAPSPTPAPTPKPKPPEIGVAGAQKSLFGGQDMKTGQKSLFNVALPSGGGKPKKPDAYKLPSLRELGVVPIPETPKQSPSLPGQKSLYSLVGDAVADCVARYARGVVSNPEFEALHPRDYDGKFIEKDAEPGQPGQPGQPQQQGQQGQKTQQGQPQQSAKPPLFPKFRRRRDPDEERANRRWRLDVAKKGGKEGVMWKGMRLKFDDEQIADDEQEEGKAIWQDIDRAGYPRTADGQIDWAKTAQGVIGNPDLSRDQKLAELNKLATERDHYEAWRPIADDAEQFEPQPVDPNEPRRGPGEPEQSGPATPTRDQQVAEKARQARAKEHLRDNRPIPKDATPFEIQEEEAPDTDRGEAGNRDTGAEDLPEFGPEEPQPTEAPEDSPSNVPEAEPAPEPQPEPQAPQQSTGRGTIGPGTASVSDLAVDPNRFQYKLHTDNPAGVTQQFSDAKFNPELAGSIHVWEDPDDGKTYVVNGHHRFELAQRSGYDGPLQVYRLKAGSAQEARAKGALINIAGGNGTAVDAAKFMRDTGTTPDEMNATHGVSLKGAVARDAAIMSKLSPGIFRRLTTGIYDEGRALAIAKHLPKHEDQDRLDRFIEKAEGSGREISNATVDELAREAAMAGRQKQVTKSLFGDLEDDKNLFLERATLKGALRRDLSTRLNKFKAVSTTRAAKTLEGKNQIDAGANRAEADRLAQFLESFDMETTRRGPVSDRLNQAAQELASAPRKQKQILDNLARDLDALIQSGGAGGSVVPPNDSRAAEGVSGGRGGDFEELEAKPYVPIPGQKQLLSLRFRDELGSMVAAAVARYSRIHFPRT